MLLIILHNGIIQQKLYQSNIRSKYVEYLCHHIIQLLNMGVTLAQITVIVNCHSNIEDEFYLVLKCPHFHDIRCKYIEKCYWKKASVFKYIQQLSGRNFRELCNIGCYLQHAFAKREIFWLTCVRFCIIQHHVTKRIFFLCYIVCMLEMYFFSNKVYILNGIAYYRHQK